MGCLLRTYWRRNLRACRLTLVAAHARTAHAAHVELDLTNSTDPTARPNDEELPYLLSWKGDGSPRRGLCRRGRSCARGHLRGEGRRLVRVRWWYQRGCRTTHGRLSGTVTNETYPPTKEFDGGFCVLQLPSREAAILWAAKIAKACRCPQELREFGYDPES